MTYASPAGTYDLSAIISSLQVRRNKRLVVNAQWYTSLRTTDRAADHIFKNDAVTHYERIAGHTNRLSAEEITFQLWDRAQYRHKCGSAPNLALKVKLGVQTEREGHM
ncbi:hypothetical protein Zmor_008889 [Zophobas morio]|jgi:hypothetical protein|uniref:Uncharacterized protein n=1 Tax=Zophobas morio TaxID=2755281 RepID=A0AA38LZG2_9CUCU|nr:hypothetical protein Zmor_008889 [Zophobas morio]